MEKTTFTCTHIYTFVQNICVIAVYFGSNAFLIVHTIVWLIKKWVKCIFNTNIV